MKVSVVHIGKTILFSSLAFIFLFFAFKHVDFSSFWTDITQANYWWVAIAIVCALIGYILRAVRWNLLLEPLGYTPSKINSFHAVVFGYFANLAFPRLGEVARCGVLNRKEQIPIDTLVGTVIIERIIDLVMLALLTIITFFIKIDFFGSFIYQHIVLPSSEAVGRNYILIVSVLVTMTIVFFVLLRYSSKTNLIYQKIQSFCRGILHGIVSIKSVSNKPLFVIYTVAIWAMYWLMSWLVCFSFEATSHFTAVDGLFLLIVGGIGMAVPVQGGIGVFHFITAQAITMYGLSEHTGLLYATVNHESQLLFIIVMGCISSFYIFIAKNKQHV
ncbi:MAG TPA: lysylphosphatidylglycerol synthase transmembrane domain-containing protein [Bacteroidales bacterium]|nr:lysylphosphatidylglycerol synthase transmembrane domain-containing protein [Bacteroidales bacterium]HRS19131.1 lysylphosphatidylglycerol synthase transmembrane domain-containing protein [Bacteroidales bacterium]